MSLETVAQLADIIGAISVPVALYFGVRALFETADARRDAVDERRRLFELDILRELLAEVDRGFLVEIEGSPHRLREYEYRLSLMSRADLPFWWTLIGMQWQDEVSAYLGFKERWHAKSVEIFESAKRRESLPASEVPAWRRNHDRLAAEVVEIADEFRATVQSELVRQLTCAVTGRVEAGRDGRSSRTWYLRRRRAVGHVN